MVQKSIRNSEAHQSKIIMNSYTKPVKNRAKKDYNEFKGFFKGLGALCYSFCIFIFIFFLFFLQYIYRTFIHTVIHSQHSMRPISISSQLNAQWAEPPWTRDSNSGLPYSKPAHNHLNYAAPSSKLRCTFI
jgi:hypothetical protein